MNSRAMVGIFVYSTDLMTMPYMSAPKLNSQTGFDSFVRKLVMLAIPQRIYQKSLVPNSISWATIIPEKIVQSAT